MYQKVSCNALTVFRLFESVLGTAFLGLMADYSWAATGTRQGSLTAPFSHLTRNSYRSTSLSRPVSIFPSMACTTAAISSGFSTS